MAGGVLCSMEESGVWMEGGSPACGSSAAYAECPLDEGGGDGGGGGASKQPLPGRGWTRGPFGVGCLRWSVGRDALYNLRDGGFARLLSGVWAVAEAREAVLNGTMALERALTLNRGAGAFERFDAKRRLLRSDLVQDRAFPGDENPKCRITVDQVRDASPDTVFVSDGGFKNVKG